MSNVLIAALCCCASLASASEDTVSEDLEQIVARHDTTSNPFIVPSIGGRIGDPFPSYWDGVWHVYTLRKGLDVVLHFTSTDLVVWNEHKPAMVGRGIATGTVVRHDNACEANVDLSTPQTKVDIVVRSSEGFDSGYRISVEPDKQVAAIRHFTSYDGVFDEMAHVSDDGRSFRVKAFVYDGIIEVFVDGRTALSTRVAERSNYRVAIDVSGGQATITNPLLHYFNN